VNSLLKKEPLIHHMRPSAWDWGARASTPAAFGVSPKASGPGDGSLKNEWFCCPGQSAGRRLEATGTVALPNLCMAGLAALRFMKTSLGRRRGNASRKILNQALQFFMSNFKLVVKDERMTSSVKIPRRGLRPAKEERPIEC
jgi:hypothetical protein